MVRGRIAGLIGLGLLAMLAAGLAQAPAASADVPSPAGGLTIIVAPPALSVSPVIPPPISPIVTLRGGADVHILLAPHVPGAAIPNVLFLTPTPATGSLVVPLRVSPASGSGPSFTQLQLVIPGPNPAQNTTVSLAQLLTTLLASPQLTGGTPPTPRTPPPSVSVFSTPSR